jgi:hypothetical protein
VIWLVVPHRPAEWPRRPSLDGAAPAGTSPRIHRRRGTSRVHAHQPDSRQPIGGIPGGLPAARPVETQAERPGAAGRCCAYPPRRPEGQGGAGRTGSGRPHRGPAELGARRAHPGSAPPRSSSRPQPATGPR